ncbi:MAG: hypothetical protein IIA03_12105, partial [Proteobacteria bacterium]|nr:hypothetical protein [Pseudomonadota bacterium]
FAIDGAIFGREAPPWLRALLVGAAIALVFPAPAAKLPALFGYRRRPAPAQ